MKNCERILGVKKLYISKQCFIIISSVQKPSLVNPKPGVFCNYFEHLRVSLYVLNTLLIFAFYPEVNLQYTMEYHSTNLIFCITG